ncbi:MAG: HDIG domain-containing metalloprotein [Bacteroidota bacterium]
MPEETRGIHIFALLKRVYLGKTVVTKILIALVLAILLTFLFPRGESIEFDYKVGAIWAQNDLIAPFSFPILRDEKAYQLDVEEARQNVYDVFERDSAETDRELFQLQQFFSEAREAIQLREAYIRDLRRNAPEAGPDSVEFAKAAARLSIPLSERDWEIISGLAMSGHLEEFQKSITSVIDDYLRAGILDRSKSALTRPEIALRHGTNEEIVPGIRFFDQGEVVTLLEQALKGRFQTDPQPIDLAYRIAIQHIAPNIKYNPEETEQAVGAAIDAVPRTAGYVQENERIISKHERITPEIKLRLDSLRKAKAERGPEGGSPWQFVGMFLHVLIVILLYGIYLHLFRKRIFASNRRLALIGILILLEGVFAYLTREIDTRAPIEFLIFVPAASMLLTIIFDSRVGFYGTVIIAFVVAGIRGNDYGTALCAFVAGALAVYTVRDMRYRAQIFRSLGYIFLGYAVSIVALGLERFASISVIMSQLGYGLLNAVISPVLTYGLLVFFERVFKVTTDLTLLELAQFNHPLLRMLAVQAPGTYHHSISMATLAEAAASSVGANEILARVGAYFHDIGKIEKPAYFVENQKTVRSRHDKISPRMSSLIICSHVKDGIALAREYGLPEEVIDFIPMHHGTTRIDYFYSKALEIARQDSNPSKIDEIKESDYRYPGPKPQTKETGIMMLADAVEAAVRTIEEPTPERIENTIAGLITKRFEEGELDECPLTLKDLTRIRGAFLNVLVGAYHSRVRYPEIEQPRRRSRRGSADRVHPGASRNDLENDRGESTRFRDRHRP